MSSGVLEEQVLGARIDKLLDAVRRLQRLGKHIARGQEKARKGQDSQQDSAMDVYYHWGS